MVVEDKHTQFLDNMASDGMVGVVQSQSLDNIVTMVVALVVVALQILVPCDRVVVDWCLVVGSTPSSPPPPRGGGGGGGGDGVSQSGAHGGIPCLLLSFLCGSDSKTVS